MIKFGYDMEREDNRVYEEITDIIFEFTKGP